MYEMNINIYHTHIGNRLSNEVYSGLLYKLSYREYNVKCNHVFGTHAYCTINIVDCAKSLCRSLEHHLKTNMWTSTDRSCIYQLKSKSTVWSNSTWHLNTYFAHNMLPNYQPLLYSSSQWFENCPLFVKLLKIALRGITKDRYRSTTLFVTTLVYGRTVMWLDVMNLGTLLSASISLKS